MVDYQTISIVLTGIGLMIALIYYGLQIRNQNRTRQAQLFMQMYDRWSDDTRGLNVRSVVNTKLSGFNEYLEKYQSDENFKEALDALFGFYEGLGVIVKERYMDIRLVALMWAGMTRRFYENIVDPIIDGAIEYWNAPRVWSETVYVCKELIKYIDDHPELKT
jgi:hypothetical protein